MWKYGLVFSLISTSAIADCDYKFDVNTKFDGVIQSSKNYDRKASDYVDETRKCVVSMDLKISDKWYPAVGSYVFGPDMTQNEACKRAEIAAKEDTLRKNVPEKLNKKALSNCQKSIDVPTRKVHTISYKTDKPKMCKKVWYPVIINNAEVLAYKEVCND